MAGLWEGLISAIADELFEMSGTLMVRTAAAYTAGSATITVDGTDRFPTTGRLSIAGVVATYTGKTATTFTGLLDEDGNVGIPVNVSPLGVVVDISRSVTQTDDLRASFLVTLAEGEELDVLARNYGLFRPRGIGDTAFRTVLREVLFGDAQTIHLCEEILDALVGPGLYEIYEDLESFPHTVFVVFPISGSSDVYKGKAFLCGGEPQPQDSASTVIVDNPVTTVYGVYSSTDAGRTGTNYAMLDITVSTAAGSPTEVTSAAAFLLADDGLGVILDGLETWTASYVNASTLALSRGDYDDGQTDGVLTDRFVSQQRRFSPWMEGHTLVILDGPNAGSYSIDTYLNPGAVESTGAGFALDAVATWRVVPNFGTLGGRSLLINRATAVGATITVPTTPLPANVLVDYTTVPSAQVLPDFSFDGDDQYPLYLWDEGYLIQTFLDLITAAGVRVVLVPE